MSYATEQDLIDRFGAAELLQLTDRDGDGVADAGVAQRALDDATDEINAYLATRYILPLDTPPPVLTRVACDIARYRLWDDGASEEVRSRYDDARKLLHGISRGEVSLGAVVAEDEGGGEVVGDGILVSGSPKRLFGRGRS